MTKEEAKEVLRQTGPPGNIVEHIEALHVALQVLGSEASMEDIWKWVEKGEK